MFATRVLTFAATVALALGATPAASFASVAPHHAAALTTVAAAKVGTAAPAGPRLMPRPTTGTVTPEDFGAVGNGIADDTRAVQAAINAAGNTKIVWLGANKTYLCRATIDALSGTDIEGAGPSTVMKFTWFDGAGTASKGSHFLGNKDAARGNTDLTFSNFVVAGPTNGMPSGSNATHPNGMAEAVHLRQVATFSITHMEVMNTPGIGIEYHGSSNGTIGYNHVHNTGRDGITAYVGSRNTHDIIVANNLVEKTGDDGIAVNGLGSGANNTALPYNIQILNNKVQGWPTDPNGLEAGRGIALSGADRVLVQNNSVTFGQTYALLTRGCTSFLCGAGDTDPATGKPWLNRDIRVLNNTITHTGGGGYGVLIDTSRTSTVTGNTITNPSGTVLRNLMCQNCTIQ
jgi:polygalacturonase